MHSFKKEKAAVGENEDIRSEKNGQNLRRFSINRASGRGEGGRLCPRGEKREPRREVDSGNEVLARESLGQLESKTGCWPNGFQNKREWVKREIKDRALGADRLVAPARRPKPSRRRSGLAGMGNRTITSQTGAGEGRENNMRR